MGSFSLGQRERSDFFIGSKRDQIFMLSEEGLNFHVGKGVTTFYYTIKRGERKTDAGASQIDIPPPRKKL